jgi:hypothetical protein
MSGVHQIGSAPFWSSAAKESSWVHKELCYALGRKKGDDAAPPEIRPVILEGPPVVPPPPELAHMHFNDYLIYFQAKPGNASVPL